MALSIAKTLRSFKAKASRPAVRTGGAKYRGRRFTTRATYSTSFVNAYATASASVSKWWAAATAAPLAIAAFWGTSTQNKNDVDTLLADAQQFEKLSESGTEEELLSLALKMLASVRAMPDSELLKQPEFVPQVVGVITSYLAAIHAPEAEGAVELLYSLARRVDAENKYPEMLRIVYRADFALQAQNSQIPQAKKLLLLELDLLRKIEGTSTSMEQSDLLFYLSVLSAADADPQAGKYLEESNKLFNGVTAATLSSNLENYWRMCILNQLQFALTCEGENKQDMAKLFKTSSKTLYEAFKKISPNKQNIPEFRDIEVYAKMSLQNQEAK